MICEKRQLNTNCLMGNWALRRLYEEHYEKRLYVVKELGNFGFKHKANLSSNFELGGGFRRESWDVDQITKELYVMASDPSIVVIKMRHYLGF